MELDRYAIILREVINLAKIRRNEYEGKYASSKSKKMTIKEYLEVEDKTESDLYNFLNALDYETIKVLQTLMYLGRDKDYNKNLHSRDIYLRERSYFDNQVGWKTKEIEINQMVEKLPLDEYLEDALEILRIEL